MNELLSAYRLLLDTADRRRQAIIQHDTQQLSSCYHRELHILEQITSIQNEWMKAASQYLREQGMTLTEAVTVDSLAQCLPETEEREAYLAIRDELTDVISEIKRSNNHNRQLIERRLHDIDSLVGLYQDDGGQVTYSHPSVAYPPDGRGGVNRFESRA